MKVVGKEVEDVSRSLMREARRYPFQTVGANNHKLKPTFSMLILKAGMIYVPSAQIKTIKIASEALLNRFPSYMALA